MDHESHIHLIWFLKNLTLVTPRWLSGASCFVKQWSGNAMGKTLKVPKNIPSPAWHLHGRGQMKSCRKHFLKFFIPINLSKVHNKPSSWFFEIFSQKKLRFLIAGWNFDLKVIIIENWICPIWVFSKPTCQNVYQLFNFVCQKVCQFFNYFAKESENGA